MSIIHTSKLEINEIGDVRNRCSIFLERDAEFQEFTGNIALHIWVLTSSVPARIFLFCCFQDGFWNDPTEIVTEFAFGDHIVYENRDLVQLHKLNLRERSVAIKLGESFEGLGNKRVAKLLTF